MPTRSTLIRWGGIAAIVLGALHVLYTLSATLGDPLPYYLFTLMHLDSVQGIPMLLLTVGSLIGLHARHAGNHGYGRLGKTGFVLAVVGSLLARALGLLMFPGGAGGWPPSFADMVVSGAVGIAAVSGMLLLGLATLRAAVLPSPWRALPLAIFLLGVPFSTLTGPLIRTGIDMLIFIYAQQLLVGVGWVLLGYALWSGIGEGVWRHAGVR